MKALLASILFSLCLAAGCGPRSTPNGDAPMPTEPVDGVTPAAPQPDSDESAAPAAPRPDGDDSDAPTADAPTADQPDGDEGTAERLPGAPTGAKKPSAVPPMTPEDCEKVGTMVGDPGDGRTRKPDFVCPNGKKPIGTVQMGIEGSVCCPL